MHAMIHLIFCPLCTYRLEEGSIPATLDDSKISKTDILRDLMLDKERLSEWDFFVQSTLQAVLDHQLVGSFDSTPNIGISIVSVLGWCSRMLVSVCVTYCGCSTIVGRFIEARDRLGIIPYRG